MYLKVKSVKFIQGDRENSMFQKISACFSILLLFACGGGESQKSPPANPSSSAASVDIAYNLNEDEELIISMKGEFWLTDKNWTNTGNQSLSLAGSKLTKNNESKKITYKPQEDYFGSDDFYYVDEVSTTTPKKVHAIINVMPVTDASLRWKIEKVMGYPIGERTTFPFPLDPDSGELVTPDTTTQLLLDGKPLAFQIQDQMIEVEIPLFERAGTYQLSWLQGEATNAKRVDMDINLTLKEDDAIYYLGNKNTAGSMLVMVRTQDVSDEQYLNWINNHLLPFLRQPLVAQYSNYWGFAVITPAAEEKISLYKDLKIADGVYYGPFVDRYLPRHTEIIVLLGSNFRANGGYPITMNIYNNAGTLFHEVGHSHAKLGDEYDEDCTYEYRDKTYPNVSANFLNDLSNIQWQHWVENHNNIPGVNNFAHGETDIGVFLGAYYCSDKYYRPAQRTLMKDYSQPPNAVDTEAWVLATYENLGLLESLASDQKKLINSIHLEKMWDKSLTKIRWFLNDIELTQFSNQPRLEVDESNIENETYSLRAELTDLTGMVRNPHAYKAFNSYYDGNTETRISANRAFTRTWIFRKSAVQTQKKHATKPTAANKNQWTKHGIFIGTNGHQLVQTVHHQAQDTLPPVTGASDLMAEIVVNGVVRYLQGVDLEQFHMEGITAPMQIKQFYTLVHPALNETYTINIYRLPERELITVLSVQPRQE